MTVPIFVSGPVDYVDAIDTRVAVYFFRRQELAHHRPVATGVNRHVGTPGDIAHLAHVSLREFERHVAGDRSNAKYLEFIG